MSAGQDFASIRSSTAVEVISAVPPQSVKPTAMSPLEGVRLFVPQNNCGCIARWKNSAGPE